MSPRPRTLPRRIPRQRRAQDTAAAIVTAAAHLLATRGFAGATTNHIAARAGVSIGSLYKYFPSKHAIAAEVARRRIDDEVAAIAADLADLERDPRAALAALIAAMAERYARHAALDTALLEQLGPIEIAPFLRAAEARVVEATQVYFAAHARAGRMRALAPDAAFVVVHALRGVLVAAAAQCPARLGQVELQRALGALVAGLVF